MGGALARRAQKYTEAIASTARLAQRSRAAHLERHGSPDNVFASMKLELIDSSGDANLSRFYRLYKTIFTLPEERESYEGFDQVFGFNCDARLLERFGFFHESAICASDGESGELVAAVSVITCEMPTAVRHATSVDVAMVGGTLWWTSPVAFANGDGTFRVTNMQLP